jgi:hypothetical protein
VPLELDPGPRSLEASMADLSNSERELHQSTYTPLLRPVRPREPVGDTQDGRAWERRNIVALLGVTREELAAVRGALGDDEREQDVVALRGMERAIERTDRSGSLLDSVAELREVDSAGVIGVIERVIDLREQRLELLAGALATLSAQAGAGPIASLEPPELEPPPTEQDGWSSLGQTLVRGVSATVYTRTRRREPPGDAGTAPADSLPSGAITDSEVVDGDPAAGPQTVGGSLIEERDAVEMVDPIPPTPVSEPVDRSIAALITPASQGTGQWSARDDAAAAAREAATALAQMPWLDTGTPAAALRTLKPQWMAAQRAMVADLHSRLDVEPVGVLHLERLGFRPAGIERGELLYSVPLAPKEEVNISHREWSNTSEEYEQIVTDFLEEFSEEGVAEKSELGYSTSTESQHGMGLNTSVTASGQIGAVNITAAASFNLSDSVSRSEESTRKLSTELTRRASKRSTREHKMSFRVASARETTDEAVRRITNTLNHAARIDYYQLVRRWNVSLYRYGVRMTYDLIVPEPGLEMLGNITEIQRLQQALAEGFPGSTSGPSWARFTLQPQDLTRANYASEAAKHSAVVETPPAETKVISRSFGRSWTTLDSTENAYSESLDVEIDPGYQVSGVHIEFYGFEWPGWSNQFFRDSTIATDQNLLIGRTDRATVTMNARYASTVQGVVVLTLRLLPSAFESWRSRAWSTIHDAAERRYYEQRVLLQTRLGELTASLATNDVLSLRKAEREEVMKGVIRWLFGPGFTFVPTGVSSDLYTDQKVADATTYALLRAQGTLVKFLHQAIEWENMLFLLYPYFWSNYDRWEMKKSLQHPDPQHRAFLKAGAARVVITIRPGFEIAFCQLMNGGSIPDNHPYVTIAQEMQNYAQTNYPGISPANEEESYRPLLTPRQRRAWADIQQYQLLLERYRDDQGRYPTPSEGLSAALSYVAAGEATPPANDPWGHGYHYLSPGEYGPYDLSSLGKDDALGGDGDDADITSWAEGSLVARWNEYTPTSAMDIRFNETLPDA